MCADTLLQEQSSAHQAQVTQLEADGIAPPDVTADSTTPERLAELISEASDSEPQKAALAHRCGQLFRDRLRDATTQQPNDLVEASKYLDMAFRLISEADPRQSEYKFDATISPLMDRFILMHSLEDGIKAISRLDQFLPNIPDDCIFLPRWLVLHGNILIQVFQHDPKQVENIGKAIAAVERAVHLTNDTNPALAVWLSSLGDTYLVSYSHNKQIEHLEKALHTLQRALSLASDNFPNRHSLLDSLGNASLQLFVSERRSKDLEASIGYQRQAIALSEPGFSDLAGYHRRLGLMLTHRFNQRREESDISESISAYRSARQLNPPRYRSNLPIILSELGTALKKRFELQGKADDIHEAIFALRDAASGLRMSNPILPDTVGELAYCLSLRYYLLGNINDINQAIAIQRRLLQIIQPQSQSVAGWLSNLGLYLSRRFEQTSDPTDITEAIEKQIEAVETTPDSDPNIVVYLLNLSRSYGCKYERNGDKADISQAIVLLRRALDLPYGDKAKCFNNLANALRCRYDQTGDLSDIQEAITAQQRAIERLNEGHYNLPGWMYNLASFLFRKFGHSLDPADIDGAAETQRRALEITPKSHTLYPRQLESFGHILMARFQQLHDISDIDEAITLQEMAVAIISNDHPHSHTLLGNLGNSYTARFSYNAKTEDIEKAVKTLRRALEYCPQDHPHRITRLACLADALNRLAQISRRVEDLDESIEISRQAIAIIPEGHFRMSTAKLALADALLERFQHHGLHIPDLIAASDNFKEVAASPDILPWLRLEAAGKWIRCCRILMSKDLKAACDCAIKLLALNASMEQTIESRHRRLRDSSRTVAEIVATAILYGDSSTALEWLEEGRCIVWNQINQLRSPLDELRSQHPALADEISKIREALDVATSPFADIALDTSSKKFVLQDQAAEQLRLAREWDRLVKEVRAIPDFHDFVLPKKAEYLLANLPPESVVVIINDHIRPCAALALVAGADEPIAIQLPSIDFVATTKFLGEYLSSHNARSRGAERAVRRKAVVESRGLRDVLRRLWEQVVKPIFDALAFGEPPSQPKRLWWCVTGILAFLPIHAAGVYELGGHNVSDYVVSSYIPNVSVLIDKFKNKRTEEPKVLLVSQPNTPGMNPIPETTTEVKQIRRRLEEAGIMALRLEGEDGTTSAVQDAMKEHGWVHLACHAIQEEDRPLNSGFYLKGGKVSISDLIRGSINCAEFAYLSACQTSTGSGILSDEVVHLAAAMLAAGYRSVVATMWSIQDHIAVEVADAFYAVLLRRNEENGLNKLDSIQAPYALHLATKQVRERFNNSDSALLACIPYVHFGY